MNFKRFSCLTAMVLIALVVVTFIAFFFFILGKAISGKEPVKPGEKSVSIQPVIEDFKLFIPDLGIQSEVIANVDSTDDSVYLPIIENKIAHAKFTYTPDEVFEKSNGITYLFSHQTSQASIFSNLGAITSDNKIYLKYNDNIFTYEVISKKVVEPSEVENLSSKSSTPLLRIQTCVDGVSKRLIVDAKLVGIE